MGMWIGKGRKARRSYGFDEVALVPGNLTINPIYILRKTFYGFFYGWCC